MSVTETAAFVLKVQEQQAVAALDRTRKGAESLGGGLGAASAGLDRFGNGAKKVQGVAGPAAAVVGNLSGSLALAGGNAGKAAAGVGALAGALGSGSPLAIGLALTATSVAGLITLWQGAKKAQAEYAKSAVGVGVRFRSDAAAAERELEAALGSTDPVERARDLAAANVEQQRITVQQEEAALQAARDARDRSRIDDPLAFTQGGDERTKEAIRLQELRTRDAKLTLENVKREADAKVALAGIEKMRADVAAANAKAEAKASADKAKRDAEEKQTEKELLDIQVKRLIAKADNINAEAEIFEALDREETERQRKVEQGRFAMEQEWAAEGRRIRIENERQVNAILEAEAQASYERRKQLDADFYGGLQGVAIGSFQTITGAAQQLAQDLATGQEYAAERAAIATIAQIGNGLVAEGTAAVVKGTLANLAVPGSGVPLTLGGGGAIGVGIAMGAGTAKWGASLPSSSEVSGGRAARDGGMRSRPSAGGGAGGGVTVNVSYGVTGPAPEDTARAIVGGLHTARIRGMIGAGGGM